MTERIGEQTRVVWQEPNDTWTRAVTGEIVERDGNLIRVRLPDGRILELATACIIKIEPLTNPGGCDR